MKMVLIGTLLFSNTLCAQNFEEWTQQKKTQIKYLLQQIAANQVYIDYAQKGYSILRNGLNTIQSIKKGDLKLHQDFFSGLKAVNPRFKNIAMVADIVSLQIHIIKETKSCLARMQASSQFTSYDLNYCGQVFTRLLEDCVDVINILFVVIKDGDLAMKDDERLQCIEALYRSMQDKSDFCHSFSNEIELLAFQRMGDQMEINLSKSINGLK